MITKRNSLVLLAFLAAIPWRASDAAAYVYVAAMHDGDVAVIDVATDAVVATIPVGPLPSGIAVNASGTRVYAGSLNGNAVTVIDTLTRSVVTTITVADGPQNLRFNSANNRLYVAGKNAISVVDTGTNSVVDTIDNVGNAGLASNMVLRRKGDVLYVIGTAADGHGGRAGHFWAIDTATDAVLNDSPFQWTPCALAISPDDLMLYFSDRSNDPSPGVRTIRTADYVFDVFSGAAIGTDSSLLIDPTGSPFYTLSDTAEMRTFEMPSGNYLESVGLAAPVFGSSYHFGIDIDSDAAKLYIADSGSNTVSVFDTAQQQFKYGINVGFFPNGLALVKIVDKVFGNGFE